jgi:spermidine/putrescine-binding protein
MTARAALLAAALAAAPAGRSEELHVLTWSDYFAPGTIAGFEKEFGCRVTLDYIESSDTLRAKLAGGRSGYDVAFPSDEVMGELVARGLLEKLDLSKIPNSRHLLPRFRGMPFDPRQEYSVPYLWGTTGLAYNKARVSPPPDSWAALWDPRWRGRVTILDDAREAFEAARRAGGEAPGPPTREEIARARDRLRELRPLAFESAPKDRLLRGEAWLAQAFNGDALQAAAAPERAADIGYAIPREGGTLWIDNLCIPKGAPNPALAHRFIDYLLRPEVAAEISRAVRFATPNAEARKLLPRELLEDPLVYPREEDLRRCRLLEELPPDLKAALEEAWAEVKAGGGGEGGFPVLAALGAAAVVGALAALLRPRRKAGA